jgi:RimJ/RimL family protein N-acetyltransferase
MNPAPDRLITALEGRYAIGAPIGAGGMANWERCCLGVPALVLCIARNQHQPIVEAAKAGLLYGPDIGDAAKDDIAQHIKSLIENSGLRFLLSKNGLSTVDGRGAWRVARRIVEGDIVIRRATEYDADNLFSWRNHPSIRAVSRDNDPISLEDHKVWLSTVLADPSRRLLIGLRASQPVGVVRFDIGGQTAEVSIYLVPGLSEPGLGYEFLQKAEWWLAGNCPDIRFIKAEVMNDNIPSHRLFRSSGYKVESTCYLKQVRDHD